MGFILYLYDELQVCENHLFLTSSTPLLKLVSKPQFDSFSLKQAELNFLQAVIKGALCHSKEQIYLI